MSPSSWLLCRRFFSSQVRVSFFITTRGQYIQNLSTSISTHSVHLWHTPHVWRKAGNVPSWMPLMKTKLENVPFRLPLQCSLCMLVPHIIQLVPFFVFLHYDFHNVTLTSQISSLSSFWWIWFYWILILFITVNKSCL